MSEGGDPALVGRTIAGKFVIEAFLGGGAMGGVYRAHQVALEKTVAVKVMHRSVASDAAFAQRFHREAKAASRLDHPGSMRVIDFGEEPDGLLYIAMEYLEGRNLHKVIVDDWPLSNDRIVDIVSQALAAIAVAHDMGVIHRDLKPENIMMLRGKDDEGRDAEIVKVCDFGIAKITEAHDAPQGQNLTTTGLVVGTPEYMSPEQARSETLDARSDIYAMGVILYQLLTGKRPFTGTTALAVVVKHITEEPEPPSAIHAGVHPGLEAACLKAMAKSPAARFQTAREMRAAVRIAKGSLPAPARSSAASLLAEVAPEPAPPRSRVAVAVALGALICGAALTVVLMTKDVEPAVRAAAKPAAQPTSRVRAKTAAAMPTATAARASSAKSSSAVVADAGGARRASVQPASPTCQAAQTSVAGHGAEVKDLVGLGRALDAWTACARSTLGERPEAPIHAAVNIRFTESRAYAGATCSGCPVAIASCVQSAVANSVSLADGSTVSGEPSFDVGVTFSCE